MSSADVVRVGGASGYWGESDMALPQLLAAGGLDYIVFDYLAEITMSIMARARASDGALGYATDFVSSVLAPNLGEIARQGVKIISNAGGVNPLACGAAVRRLVQSKGLKLKVAVVSGDDLLASADRLAGAGYKEMFSSEPFPEPGRMASINAYLGGFPIAEALAQGADIVITGRCVDSAVTLGACIHAFGWSPGDTDELAGGSLAGHILECGPQASGGNYTDWEAVSASLADIGYPIAEIRRDGGFTVTKPGDSGGIVTVGTVGEQMLYEIGDPQAYALPDVICDFSQVRIEQEGPNRVRVSGAKGHPAPDTYKVSATYADGWRAGAVWFYYGENAGARARAFAAAAIERARGKLRAINAPDFDETLVETIGDEGQFGAFSQVGQSREVAVKIGAKHQDQKGVAILLKEVTGLGLAAPPGLCGFGGARSKPSPVVRLFSFLIPKSEISIAVDVEGVVATLPPESGEAFRIEAVERAAPPTPPTTSVADLVEAPLVRLAFARSGDKGDKANVGVLPRRAEYAPWIWAALSDEAVAARFGHFLKGRVERFYLPGSASMNILLHEVLGGGGIASLRNDPQAKGFAQLLLQAPIPIPRAMAEAL